MQNRLSQLRTVAAMLLVASAALVVAQPIERGSTSNFEFFNTTGKPADGFEVTLEGISPSQIQAISKSSTYPKVEVKNNGLRSTVIRWYGSKTEPGKSAQFGIALTADVDISRLPNLAQFAWTANNQPLLRFPPRWWQTWSPGGGWRDVAINWWNSDIFLLRRVTIVPGPVDMQDLAIGAKVWDSAKVVDSSPVRVKPGSTLEFEYDPTDEKSVVVMGYAIRDSKGVLLANFLNTVNGLKPGGLANTAKSSKVKASKARIGAR